MTRISRATFHARLAALPEQTNPIAAMAVAGLTASWGVEDPGMCEKQLRLTLERLPATKVIIARYRRESARLTAYAFQDSRFAVDPRHGSLPGDILFKTSGEFGHVGVRATGNMVAENSTVHDTNCDARGLRTIEEFGHVDLIVRLLDPVTGKVR